MENTNKLLEEIMEMQLTTLKAISALVDTATVTSNALAKMNDDVKTIIDIIQKR